MKKKRVVKPTNKGVEPLKGKAANFDEDKMKSMVYITFIFKMLQLMLICRIFFFLGRMD